MNQTPVQKCGFRPRHGSNQVGFTLIEMLVVMAVLGILLAISGLGSGFIYTHKLNAASRELYSDLQALRLSAMTRGSGATSHGFGLRFIDNQSYQTFEFVDGGTAYTYDGAADEGSPVVKNTPSGVTVTIGAAGDAFGFANVLLYDKHGMVRNSSWGAAAGRTYVLHHPKVTKAHCVVISAVRVREGLWNESTSPSSCDEF